MVLKKRPARKATGAAAACGKQCTGAAANSISNRAGTKGKSKAKPWNHGQKHSISRAQHVFVQRKDIDIWLAALLFVGGPVHCACMYLGLVTGRRISEVLRLRGKDFCLSGGELCDNAYIRVEARKDEAGKPGLGKVPHGCAVARIGDCVVESIEGLLLNGLEWECKPVLQAYRHKHQKLFAELKPLCQKKFHPARLEDDDLWFPAIGASKQKWRSRQSIWTAVKATRSFLFTITGKRCFNPDPKFNGAHVHVHGATRHTNAALLMSNPETKQKPPSQTTILELQQRTDAATFVRHYTHAGEDDLQAALKFGSIGSPFKAAAQDEIDTTSHEELANNTTLNAKENPDLPKTILELPGPQEASVPANGEVQASTKSHCSRNAWRKAKRKAAKAEYFKQQAQSSV